MDNFIGANPNITQAGYILNVTSVLIGNNNTNATQIFKEINLFSFALQYNHTISYLGDGTKIEPVYFLVIPMQKEMQTAIGTL